MNKLELVEIITTEFKSIPVAVRDQAEIIAIYEKRIADVFRTTTKAVKYTRVLREDVLQYIATNPGVTIANISTHFDFSNHAGRLHCHKLKDCGSVYSLVAKDSLKHEFYVR